MILGRNQAFFLLMAKSTRLVLFPFPLKAAHVTGPLVLPDRGQQPNCLAEGHTWQAARNFIRERERAVERGRERGRERRCRP